jgi:CubicO group peptidase (beta-lactamase class C family)
MPPAEPRLATFAHMTEINGTVADGFGKVADAFGANFDEHDELGAAFALYVDGELKVDIWGGIADKSTGRSWDADTLQLVFSTTKGAAAVCVAQLAQAGLVDYDAAVATYWPEFAANGKEAITVGQMMSHQAGVPFVDMPLTFDEVIAVEPVLRALEAQAPIWSPGTAHGYHALTYGWLAGELVRRVDGRTIGRYFADEVARPLGLDFWIGLPESEEPRVSRLEMAPPMTDPALLEMMMAVMGPGTNGFKALFMNGALMGLDHESPFNTRAVHATEMPAANGITTARSLARMYSAMVNDVDGVRLISDKTVDIVSTERAHGQDACLVVPTRFGYGFMLDGMVAPMLTPSSFGHPGAGGSLGYADPESNVGYGYVMNQMGFGVAGDPRTLTLNDAVSACL